MRVRTIQGRSLPLNVLFVVVNLVGLTLITMGYHKSWEEQSGILKTLGFILLFASIAGIFVFQGRLMMASVSRVLVGGLMIVSGLVKANDPIGFSYKLEEYFEDGALAYRIKEWFNAPEFSMEFLMDYALPISILVCVLEIIFGVLTLLGGKIKLVSYLMLGMMLFFTALTWHTKSCDKNSTFVDRDRYEVTDPVGQIKLKQVVTNEDITLVLSDDKEIVIDEVKKPQCVDDCGCFGDALKGSVGRSLTPAESFWKDIILVYLVLWIFVSQWIIQPNNRKENVVYFVGGMIVITFFSYVFGWYFPVLFGLVAYLGALWVKQFGGKIFGNFWGSSIFVALLCAVMVFFVMRYVPIKDYRPYAVGNDLNEKMNDGVAGVSEYYYWLINLETGKKKREKMSKLPKDVWTNTKKWKADYDGEEIVVESKNPSIMDFKPIIYVSEMNENEKNLPFIKDKLTNAQVEVLRVKSIEYNEIMDVPLSEFDTVMYPSAEYDYLDTVTTLDPNLTDIQISEDVLAQDKIVLLVSQKMNKADWRNLGKIKAIFNSCKENNVPFIMVANGLQEDLNAFRKENKFDVPLFLMDEIELKIVSRSNPAIVVLEKGIVKEKYSHRMIPSKEKFKTKFLK